MHWREVEPTPIRHRIEQVLEPGEQVQWVGLPVPRYNAREVRSSLIAAAAALAFGVFWLVKTCGAGGPQANSGTCFAFVLFGVGALAGAACLALSPFRGFRRWLRRAYVVTNRRMIAFDGRKCATLRRFETEPVGDLVRVDHRDGTCDLLIEPGVTTEYAAFEQDGPVGFFHIRDGDVVAELLPKLASRYKPIPTIVHPSQDRAHSRAVRGGIAFTLLVTVPLFFLGFVGPPAVLYFATVLGLIAYAFVRGRSSTCPRCGAHLVRDPDTPRGTYYFTCTKCRVRWASRIITT